MPWSVAQWRFYDKIAYQHWTMLDISPYERCSIKNNIISLISICCFVYKRSLSQIWIWWFCLLYPPHKVPLDPPRYYACNPLILLFVWQFINHFLLVCCVEGHYSPSCPYLDISDHLLPNIGGRVITPQQIPALHGILEVWHFSWIDSLFCPYQQSTPVYCLYEGGC